LNLLKYQLKEKEH